jgi:hypothetical protein
VKVGSSGVRKRRGCKRFGDFIINSLPKVLLVAIVIMILIIPYILMVIQEKKAAAAKRRGKTGENVAPGLKSGEASHVDAEDGVFESCDNDIACAIRIGGWCVINL